MILKLRIKSIIDEMETRRERQINVLFFNVLESQHADPKQRIEADTAVIKKHLLPLGKIEEHIKMFRVEKSTGSHPRQ